MICEPWYIPTREKRLEVGEQIARRTGGGLVVVDVDRAVIPDYLTLTYTVRTPRGWHLYYEHDQAVKSGLVDNCVEVRGEYSWVVCPPTKGYVMWRAMPCQPLPTYVVDRIERGARCSSRLQQQRLAYFRKQRLPNLCAI